MNTYLFKFFFIFSCVCANTLNADNGSVDDFTIHSESGLIFPLFEGQEVFKIDNEQQNGFERKALVFRLNNIIYGSEQSVEGVILLMFAPHGWFDGGSPPKNPEEYVSAFRLNAVGSIGDVVLRPGGSGEGVITSVSSAMNLRENQRTWHYYYYTIDVYSSGTISQSFILDAYMEIENFLFSVTLVGPDVADLESYLRYSAVSIEVPQ